MHGETLKYSAGVS